MVQELLQHQEELQTLRIENLELRETQGHVSAYEADLESELQEKDYKVSHLEEELSRLHQLSQVPSKTALRWLDENELNLVIFHVYV